MVKSTSKPTSFVLSESSRTLRKLARQRADRRQVHFTKTLGTSRRVGLGQKPHHLNHVERFQQVPSRKRKLGARAHCDRKDVVGIKNRVRQAIEGAEHVLVSEIVSHAKRELHPVSAGLRHRGCGARRLGTTRSRGPGVRMVHRYQSLDNLTLVDEGWSDLEVSLTRHHIYIPALGDATLKLLLAGTSCGEAEYLLCTSIVPS